MTSKTLVIRQLITDERLTMSQLCQRSGFTQRQVRDAIMLLDTTYHIDRFKDTFHINRLRHER